MKKLLVFTDLDGTLLHHYNYSWESALPALTLLKENEYPVIFTSSKTTSEILEIKNSLINRHPFIAENGAVINIPEGYFISDSFHNESSSFISTYLAREYKDVIKILQRLRTEYQFKFRGFNDITVDELVALTDLTEEQAILSKQRDASEPLLWKDSVAALSYFEELLDKEDLILTKGGRFHHVMSDVNKGIAVKRLKKEYQKNEPGTEWVTIGLGDSFNDIELLEAVDYPVLIKNPVTNQPYVEDMKNIFQSSLPGPEGWNEAISKLMKEIL